MSLIEALQSPGGPVLLTFQPEDELVRLDAPDGSGALLAVPRGLCELDGPLALLLHAVGTFVGPRPAEVKIPKHPGIRVGGFQPSDILIRSDDLQSGGMVYRLPGVFRESVHINLRLPISWVLIGPLDEGLDTPLRVAAKKTTARRRRP